MAAIWESSRDRYARLIPLAVQFRFAAIGIFETDFDLVAVESENPKLGLAMS
jgi:hypothetical protein